ncbi:MAG TPA: SUF system Fe-S cluster assembly regulator [Deltaproteobacteria bacterium]|jgi:FeS assembly SUF system regulator|nr:SUF system Fe-S cluster assembly regulator [Deltaproteobacteria bacterium]
MIRMSKLTDYGIVLLAELGSQHDAAPHNARELSLRTHLPLPVVSKLLKALAREGVLLSHRGAKGGYSLSRQPEQISVAEVIRVLEGPIALTECGTPGLCAQEQLCQVRTPWQRINEVIRDALSHVTLAELIAPTAGSRGGAPGDSFVPLDRVARASS